MSKEIEVSTIIWRGIKITINYKPKYFESTKTGFSIAHLEVVTENKTPLPFTESGYRSHFTNAGDIETYGTATDFVKAWLEETAKSKKWIAQERKLNQLSLF